MKTIKLTETQLNEIVKKMLLEQPQEETKGKRKDKKPRCIPENIISLDEIAGRSDEFSRY